MHHLPQLPDSPTRASLNEGEHTTTLKDVDDFLSETASPTYPRLQPRPSTSSTPAILSLLALLLFSTLTAHLAPHVALQSRLTVLVLPLLHFAALVALGLVHGCARPRGIFGGGARRIMLGRGEGSEEGWRRKLSLLTGGSSAVAMLAGLWEARWLDGKVWQAIEVSLIPTLLALAPLIGAFLLSSSRSHPPPTTFTFVCIASSFLVAFSLIGVPAVGSGLAIAVLRLPFEAGRFVLIKEGLGELQIGEYLMGSAITGVLVSVGALVLGFLPSSDESGIVLTSADFFSLVAYTILALLTQLSLLSTLYHFSSPVYPAATLIPRNLILLLVGTFGRGGIRLRGNWAQMTCVLAGGTVATIVGEPDLSSSLRDAVRSVRSKVGLGGRASWNHERLPSSSSPTTSSPPQRYVPSIQLALFPFIPLLIYLIQSPSTTTSLAAACSYLPINVRSTLCHTLTVPQSRTVDLVFAFYDENLDEARHHIANMRNGQFVKERSNRVVLYNKGPRSENELRHRLELRKTDEVIPLENYGREGATYLKHIVLHYNASISALASALDTSYTPPTLLSLRRTRVLADHTFFLQAHLAWDFIAQPRIDLVGPDTGFAHFGPMMRSDCGKDGRGTGNYPVLGELYNIFRGEICPPTGQLSAWSAQFVVSKQRILANAYHRYDAFDKLMEAPDGHWIHNMWGANGSGGQSNPAVGHHLERSWPIIFGCSDPTIADECPDEIHIKEKCQCLDY